MRKEEFIELANVIVAFLIIVAVVVLAVMNFKLDYENRCGGIRNESISQYYKTQLENEGKKELDVDVNAYVFLEEIPLSEEWQMYVQDVCKEKDVPVCLIYAVAEQESGFNPEAVGVDGKDIGLMQIRTINHDWLNEKAGRELDYKDEFDNALAGILMIDYLMSNNEENVNDTMLAYNMGQSGANKAKEKGICSTEYTESVIEKMQKWEDLFYE